MLNPSAARLIVVASVLFALVLTPSPLPAQRTAESNRSSEPWFDPFSVPPQAFARYRVTHENNANATTGDPVDAVLGEFVSRIQDLFLGGPLPLTFSRYFGSSAGVYAFFQGFYGRTESPMGANWVHNHQIFLSRIAASILTIHFREGYILAFSKTGDVWGLTTSSDHYRGTAFQLLEEGSRFRLMDPRTQQIYIFDDVPGAGQVGVHQVKDRNGNTHTYSYNPDGTLARVEDSLGRFLEFSYTESGGKPRVNQVLDQGGRRLRFAYAGVQLTSVEDPLGRMTAYTYAADDRLASMQSPLGHLRVRNEYNEFGNVAAQLDARGNQTTIVYENPSTVVTDPLGGERVFEFNNLKRLVRLTDEAGKSIEFEYDAANRRVATIDRLGARSSVTYDPVSGLVTSRTDSAGHTWNYGYTPQLQDGFTFHNLTSIDFPDETRETYQYDSQGNVTQRVDRAGQSWNATYNARGQLETATNPKGGLTSLAYNPDGTPASLEDPAGNRTQFGYDEFKRLNLVTHPDQSTLQLTYDANSNLLSRTDEEGSTTTYGYDDDNRLESLTDPLGRTWMFHYDADGRVIELVDPLGQPASFQYDALGRRTRSVDRSGRATTYEYDAVSRLTGIQDPLEQGPVFSYDDEGIPLSLTTALGDIWSYTSDVLGRIVTVQDPLLQNHHFEYDALSRLTAYANPLDQVTAYLYDARGLLGEAFYQGTGGTYQRDALGRIEQVTDARGNSRHRSFDAAGRLVESRDGLGRTFEYAYDARNRVSHVDLPLSSADFLYDATGRLKEAAYSDGTQREFDYDAAGRLTGGGGISLIRDETGRIVESNGILLTRDPDGRILSVTCEAGRTVTYSYEARGLLQRVSDWNGGQVEFSYDAAGRLLQINRSNGVQTHYAWDSADRLLSITEKLGEASLSSTVLVKDAAGRTVEAERDVPLEPSMVEGRRQVGLDAADQIEEYEYDAMGRLSSGAGQTFSWDLASNLTSYRDGELQVEFTYDALGNRLSRQQGESTRQYLWNYALVLPSVCRLQEDGQTPRFFVHTPGGELLYSLDAAGGTRRFYHFDEQGTALFLTDDDGILTDSYAYDSYGSPAGMTGTTDNPFTFVGRYGVMNEPGTGLYSMRARTYDSRTGRFLSPDPLGFDPADPRTLDLYQYAAGDPLQYIDPLGTIVEPGHRGPGLGPQPWGPRIKGVKIFGLWVDFSEDGAPGSGRQAPHKFPTGPPSSANVATSLNDIFGAGSPDGSEPERDSSDPAGDSAPDPILNPDEGDPDPAAAQPVQAQPPRPPAVPLSTDGFRTGLALCNGPGPFVPIGSGDPGTPPAGPLQLCPPVDLSKEFLLLLLSPKILPR